MNLLIKISFFIGLLLFSCFPVFPQDSEVDSLLRELALAKADTSKAAILYHLSEVCDENDIVKYATELLSLSEKTGYREGIAGAANNLGYAYHLSEPDKALQFYFKAMKIREELNDTPGVATVYNNIGAVYQSQGSISKAIEYHFKGLKMQELLGDKEGLARAYHNLALIYKGQNEVEKALEYNLLSLKIREEIGDKDGMGTSLNNIGVIYGNKEENEKALDYYLRSLKIREELNDKKGLGPTYSNLGNLFLKQDKPDSAMAYLNKALLVAEEMHDLQNKGFVLTNIARIFTRKGETAKAIECDLKALEIGKVLGHAEIIMRSSLSLANDYKRIKQFEKSLAHFEAYAMMKDSMNNLETKKASMKAEMQHDFEQKEEKAKAEQEIKDAKANQEKELRKAREFWVSVVSGIIFIFLVAMAVFLQKRYQAKKKTSEELEAKNLIIEEKNKNITDSINYAKRIQLAIFPRPEEIAHLIPDSFVLYKPKDIVSGDFYWFAKNGDKTFVAAVDCTGHGVPGAFMSMIGNTLLNEIVIEKKVSQPSEILFLLREGIIKSLKQTGAEGESKDGMDIAFCAIDSKTNVLEFSGGNNPLWLFSGSSFVEIKGDKQPIGIYQDISKPFTNHRIQLKPSDRFYLFTDGYADQFGGEKGKKFKYAQLKELLLSLNGKSMNDQKRILEKTVDNWKGNLEQVDDICIVGIRV